MTAETAAPARRPIARQAAAVRTRQQRPAPPKFRLQGVGGARTVASPHDPCVAKPGREEEPQGVGRGGRKPRPRRHDGGGFAARGRLCSSRIARRVGVRLTSGTSRSFRDRRWADGG